jgi:hypothetical protein
VICAGPVEGEEGGAYGASDLGLWRDGDFEAAELLLNPGCHAHVPGDAASDHDGVSLTFCFCAVSLSGLWISC